MSSRAEASLEDHTLSVSGCLDVTTVAALRVTGNRLMSGLDRVTIDLSGAQVSGSAAVALLIAWQREARRRDISIEIQDPPENLVAIAEACGVDEILPFSSI